VALLPHRTAHHLSDASDGGPSAVDTHARNLHIRSSCGHCEGYLSVKQASAPLLPQAR
jgi:hypothetical protein